MREVQRWTNEEGGMWRPLWNFGYVRVESLSKRSRSVVEINGMHVHSLVLDGDERWDCINGFTGKVANAA